MIVKIWIQFSAVYKYNPSNINELDSICLKIEALEISSSHFEYLSPWN